MDSIEDAESRERLLDIARRNARTIEVALANLLAIADGPIQIMSVSQHAVAIFDRVMSLSRRSFPELRFDFRGDTDFELNCDGPKMIQALANCVTVIARRCASPGVVMCELTHSDSHHVIEFSPRDVPLSELGLEESSATLLEYDFQIAKEIIEQHKGDIVLLESDRPKIRIEIARTV